MYMKSNTKSFVALFALALMYGMTPAQVMTIDSVLARIERKNPMLREYDDRVQAMEALEQGARSWMAPMVGAGTFMTPYPGQEVMDEGARGSLMITVEQEIPNPAKLNANRRYVASHAAYEHESRSQQFNLLRTEAKTLYFQWVVAEEKLRLLKENEQLVEFMLKTARIRYPYNQSSLGSIYLAEGRLASVQNMQIMTLGVIENARARLRSLMNLPLSHELMIDTTAHLSFHPVQSAIDTALLQGRSDIHQLDRSIEIMRLNQQLQQVQAKPDFRIRFDHMQPYGDMPTQFTAMAMVSIPIAPWSSKMYKADVKSMEHSIEGMKRGREALLLEVRGMLAGMTAKLIRMNEQLDNYKTRILPALRNNFQTVKLAYEENREQLPMVLDAWEAMNMTQQDYLNMLEEYYLMIISYEKEIEK